MWDGATFISEDNRRNNILVFVVEKNYFAINDYFSYGKKILDKFEYPGRPCSGKLLVERYSDSNGWRSWEILLPLKFKPDETGKITERQISEISKRTNKHFTI